MNTRSKSVAMTTTTTAHTYSTSNGENHNNDDSAADAMTLMLQRVRITYTTPVADALDSNTFDASTPETPASFKQTIAALANKVYAVLGNAQLEKTYQRALVLELQRLHVRGVCVESERSVPIYYDGIVVGTRRADLIVGFADGSYCIIELKAVAKLSREHLKQLKYYMWHFQVPHGVLVNFPRVPDFPDVDNNNFDLEQLQGETTLSNVQLRKRAATSDPEIYYVSNPDIQPSVSVAASAATLSPRAASDKADDDEDVETKHDDIYEP